MLTETNLVPHYHLISMKTERQIINSIIYNCHTYFMLLKMFVSGIFQNETRFVPISYVNLESVNFKCISGEHCQRKMGFFYTRY